MDWDLAALFLGAWIVGMILLAAAVRATRESTKAKRISFRSLALAVAFTPSLIISTGIAPAPAVFILLSAPFRDPPYGLEYAALLGALPIAIVWLLVWGVWAVSAKGGNASS